jgi:1-acyl-sn-glycerol-3-phosphate acyltransferase
VRGDVAYALAWGLGAAIGVPYFRPRAEGLVHVRRDGPFVVACNHVTLLDWAGLAWFVPRPVRFLMTRDYYDRPALRWFCRLGGAIPVTPGRIEPTAIRGALAALTRGDAVGVFPEGRISRDDAPLPPERGIVELARRAGVPIVPATIRGAFRAFPRHARVPRPRRVTVVFGAPLAVPAHAHGHRAQAEVARELMARIAALRDVPPAPTRIRAVGALEVAPR